MATLPLTPDAVAELVVQLNQNGVATVKSLYLGALVEPPSTDLTLVTCQDGVEVWLPEHATVANALASRLHPDRPALAGGRLLFSVKGSAQDALASLDTLLDAPRRRSAATTDLGAVEVLRRQEAPALPTAAEIGAYLATRIVGQSLAITTVSTTVARHLNRRIPRNPASLLLVGPTGCGKTETARQLAAFLRDYGFVAIIINANEYSESHRVSQLLGAPAGYVGHGSGGSLADHLAANPKSIPIFDEVEKAHPALLDTLMTAMSSGQFTRAGRAGEPVDCRNGVFLFTSNALGSDTAGLAGPDGATAAEVSDACRRQLVERGMRSEIAGRFTAIVPFAKLTPAGEAEAAAHIVIELAEEYGVAVSWVAPELVAQLLSASAAAYGARSVKVLADELVGDVFAEAANANCTAMCKLVGPPWRLEELGLTGQSQGRVRKN